MSQEMWGESVMHISENAGIQDFSQGSQRIPGFEVLRRMSQSDGRERVILVVQVVHAPSRPGRRASHDRDVHLTVERA